MIVYHTADLLWATKIKATAEAEGIPARPVRTVAMLEARLADSPVRALMVDLDDAETALALIERVKHSGGGEGEKDGTGAKGVRVLAFGPHVEAEAFERARRAGADVVMARGGLARDLGGVLKRLCPAEAGQSGP